MARLPYADPATPDAKAVAERIIAERGGLLHLYRMLLHSVPLADGWLTFLTAIRQRLSLSGALRELVIVRVAILNRAQYEADQHAPIALKEGLTQRQLDALAQWERSDAFSKEQRAVLELTDRMTRDVQVPEPVIEAVREFLNDREVVELVATIAAYSMVSRFIEALGIHSRDTRSVQAPPSAH
jgi:AhpD family alkylhydroperoxidase